jgi:predicted unusual protein kinase regulating ubiquinone biosynthesis (AarF/ABC1/UbiB family)
VLLAAAGRGAFRNLLAYAIPGRGRKQRQEAAMLRTAEDVTRVMGNMKGVTMKIGQIMSLMSGSVPDGFAERMATLQAAAPPMAPELVRQVFMEDFGRPPEKLFRRFESRPFAAASIGQVHRAELHDRTKVAVKVQYPGVRDAIASDLANLGTVFGMMGVVAKGFDPGPMVEDLRQGIGDELDYALEASRQQRFYEVFEDHPFIVVPRVYPELSSARILVQQFIEGKPFAAAREMPQEARDRIAEIIFRFTFGSMHRYGLFQADPHAGNYLLLDDGRVAFLDFGCIAEFEPAVMDGINKLITGVLTDDMAKWREAMEEIGYVPDAVTLSTEEIWEQLKVYYTFIREDGVTYTPELAASLIKQNLMLTGEAGRINRQLNIPKGVVFTQRITFGFAGLMASIRATGPWRSITSEYVLGRPPCTKLGEESRRAMGESWV